MRLIGHAFFSEEDVQVPLSHAEITVLLRLYQVQNFLEESVVVYWVIIRRYQALTVVGGYWRTISPTCSVGVRLDRLPGLIVHFLLHYRAQFPFCGSLCR